MSIIELDVSDWLLELSTFELHVSVFLLAISTIELDIGYFFFSAGRGIQWRMRRTILCLHDRERGKRR